MENLLCLLILFQAIGHDDKLSLFYIHPNKIQWRFSYFWNIYLLKWFLKFQSLRKSLRAGESLFLGFDLIPCISSFKKFFFTSIWYLSARTFLANFSLHFRVDYIFEHFFSKRILFKNSIRLRKFLVVGKPNLSFLPYQKSIFLDALITSMFLKTFIQKSTCEGLSDLWDMQSSRSR